MATQLVQAVISPEVSPAAMVLVIVTQPVVTMIVIQPVVTMSTVVIQPEVMVMIVI